MVLVVHAVCLNRPTSSAPVSVFQSELHVPFTVKAGQIGEFLQAADGRVQTGAGAAVALGLLSPLLLQLSLAHVTTLTGNTSGPHAHTLSL